jgi:AmiR/NasT family two-component response regulator
MPQPTLYIAVADSDDAALGKLTAVVAEIGHKMILQATSAAELLQHAEVDDANLIVADVNVIEAGGLEALAKILQRHEAPVIVTSAASTDNSMDVAQSCRPMAHLVKPIRKEDLRVAIALAMQRFEELQTIRAEASSVSQALEERKTIERAKGIIMRQLRLDEAEAFTRLQGLARDKRMRLVDIANAVIVSESALF